MAVLDDMFLLLCYQQLNVNVFYFARISFHQLTVILPK